MYCRNCGSEIPDEAKFCTFCGTKTVMPKAQANGSFNPFEEQNQDGTQNESIVDEPLINGAAEETPEQAHALEVALANAEAASEAPSQEGKTSGSSGNNNLKAAVTQNNKRSRRRMPIILLVALALALATSVAYAAYRVYTDVWAPIQQEQQQKAQAEKDAQEAQDAYNEIIEEYAQALTEAKNGTLDFSGSSKNTTGISDKYPNVNSEPFPHSSGEPDEYYEYVYTLKDLNNDGIDELLIGKDFSKYGAYRGSVAIYDIWTYQDDKLIEIEQGITRGDYHLRANNVIMSRGNGGAQVNVYTMMTLNKGKLYDVNDLDENDISKSVNNWTKGEALVQDWPDDTSTSGKMTKYAKYDASGNLTDSGNCTLDEFSSMLDDLSSKYPEDTSVE